MRLDGTDPGSDRSWPEAGQLLLQELAAAPGRLAFLLHNSGEETIRALAELLGEQPLSVGRAVSMGTPPKSVAGVIALLGDASLLVDLDVLFWRPWLQLDPVALLRRIARRGRPLVAQWPGTASGATFTYSTPGRRDYYFAVLDDLVLLRPRPRLYPDEVPYTVERM